MRRMEFESCLVFLNIFLRLGFREKITVPASWFFEKLFKNKLSGKNLF